MSTPARAHADAQYATTDRLETRIATHRFGSQQIPWHEWVLLHLSLHPDDRVLEVGAGTGALWDSLDQAAHAPSLICGGNPPEARE